MKNCIIAISLLLSVTVAAQDAAEKTNPFLYETQQNRQEDESAKAPAPPGTGVPIDNYIPILFSVGVGILLLQRKRNVEV